MQFTKPFKLNIFSGLGGSGGGYSAGGANTISPVDINQANEWYNNVQNQYKQQQDFTNALAGQNGIQNQSNVFNQQQQLANQLQGQTMGQGPNPAQAALAQNTAANTANQAALMAGQRGTGANAGLIARQAAQQGAANQQASVGQAATLQAQQQLAAQQQLQQQQNMMAGLSGAQVGQLQQAHQNLGQYAMNEQQQLLNAIAAQNNAAIGMQSNINNVNAGIQGGNQAQQAGIFGGLMSSVGSGLSSFFADGGEVLDPAPNKALPDVNAPKSAFGRAMHAAANRPLESSEAEKQSAAFLNPNAMSGNQSMSQSGNQAGSSMGNLLGKAGKSLLGSGEGSGAVEIEGGPAMPSEGAVTSEDIGLGAGGGEGAAGGASLGAGAGLFAAPLAATANYNQDQGNGASWNNMLGNMGSMFQGDIGGGGNFGLFGIGAAHGGEIDVKRGSGPAPRAASASMDNRSIFIPAPEKEKKKEDTSILGEDFNPYAQGGEVDVMVSPGEKMYFPGGEVEKVNGKARVAGDSLKNDVVHKKVPPHTIVVPRTKADGGSKEKDFVAAILARKGLRK